MAAVISLAVACSSDGLEKKGFQVDTGDEHSDSLGLVASKDASSSFLTKPGSVLLTGVGHVRLSTVYKVNKTKDGKRTFIGSDNFHHNYSDQENDPANNWNYNLMPGLAAVYGYNLVNVSHYDIQENRQKELFEKAVLIRTLYYPSFSQDTLNGQPVNRNFLMVSVYNEDTNGDGSINLKDLRRFFLFDVNGVRQKALVPENYAVLGSDYDQGNDLMYVFAQLDENGNGRTDDGEPIHIHWVDLKDPQRTGRLY